MGASTCFFLCVTIVNVYCVIIVVYVLLVGLWYVVDPNINKSASFPVLCVILLGSK